MYKRIWRSKRGKAFCPIPVSPEGLRAAEVLPGRAGSGTAAAPAAPLLCSSAASCLLRGTTLQAVTLQTAPGEVRHS